MPLKLQYSRNTNRSTFFHIYCIDVQVGANECEPRQAHICCALWAAFSGRMCVQATASDICHVAAKSTWQLRIGLLFPACRAVISMLCEEIILLSCLPYPLNLRCSSTAWVLPAQQEQRQRMPIQIKQRQLNKIIQNPGLAFWRQQKSEEWDWLNLIIIPR
jgi:hypothetical protein